MILQCRQQEIRYMNLGSRHNPQYFLHIHIIKNMIYIGFKQKMILCYRQEILMMGKKKNYKKHNKICNLTYR